MLRVAQICSTIAITAFLGAVGTMLACMAGILDPRWWGIAVALAALCVFECIIAVMAARRYDNRRT